MGVAAIPCQANRPACYCHMQTSDKAIQHQDGGGAQGEFSSRPRWGAQSPDKTAHL